MADARKFLGGKWLRKKHIDPTKDTAMTISGVVVDRFEPDEEDEAEGEECLALKFDDIRQQLGLNETNNGVMIEMLGHETDDWVGKRITLFVDPTVKYKGERTGGVRIRSNLPTAAAKARRKTKRT